MVEDGEVDPESSSSAAPRVEGLTPESDDSREDGPDSKEWERPFPAAVLPLGTDEEWQLLRNLYARGFEDRPLDRCLEVARINEAARAVIETRYIDIDYRSEYTAYYSRAFSSYPDSTQRVHFFKSPDIELGNLADLPENPGYLGYMVIRPRVEGPVCRTLLRPPSSVEHGVQAAITEEVFFFGQLLSVRGVPFIQQDSQLGRCAHAAAWICHYSAYRRNEVNRRPIGYFSLSSNPSLATGRPFPSDGLTVSQVSDLLRLAELPAKYYSLRRATDADRPSWWKPKVRNSVEARVARICRRYLDSGLPILVTAQEVGKSGRRPQKHAFVVCGYLDLDSGSRHLIVNDDQRGPYIEVDSVKAGRSKIGASDFDWECILAPLPEKLWMSGEAAERFGCDVLLKAARKATVEAPEAQAVLSKYESGHIRIRTYAVRNNEFKREARSRFSDDALLLSAYSYARLSKFVWVVEAIDTAAEDPNRPVIGEVIFDATSSSTSPVVLATRVPGVISLRIGHNQTLSVKIGSMEFESGGAR